MMDWLELVMWVLVGLVTWLGVAIVIAKTEEGEARDAQRDRADGGCRQDVTGTGCVAGRPSQTENPGPATLLYKDVERDHRDHGDEDPPAYGLGAPRGPKWDPSILNPSAKFTEEVLRKARRKIARPHVPRRRDGIQLSDEANTELLKTIFGEGE